MTNQIVAAVMKVSSGKATVTRLQMNRQGGYAMAALVMWATGRTQLTIPSNIPAQHVL